MSSEPTSQSEPETTPEEYRQRALLMADLGRYDEAVGEIAAGLAAAPQDAGLLSTLARVHVVAEQPAQALAAADRAVAAAPGTIQPLVARAMALVDDRRYPEAAQVAASILAAWPEDAYAQRTGAALLSESRNGQEALNAAWTGVRLTPTDAEAHLVLAVVAARLRLFDLAQRAYGEALELDAAIGDAQREFGVVRLERRRWAQALEELADEATLQPPPDPAVPPVQPGSAVPPVQPAMQVSRPARSALDQSAAAADAVRHAVLLGSNSVLIAAVLVAVMTIASTGVARMWAGVIGVVILVGVGVWLSRHVPDSIGGALRAVRKPLLVAFYATGISALTLVGYALVGGVALLITAMALAAVAELVVLLQRS